MIERKSRTEVNTSRKDNGRINFATKSRDYALGSFFSSILTYITDPKDDMGIGIKTDPAYLEDSKRRTRQESD